MNYCVWIQAGYAFRWKYQLIILVAPCTCSVCCLAFTYVFKACFATMVCHQSRKNTNTDWCTVCWPVRPTLNLGSVQSSCIRASGVVRWWWWWWWRWLGQPSPPSRLSQGIYGCVEGQRGRYNHPRRTTLYTLYPFQTKPAWSNEWYRPLSERVVIITVGRPPHRSTHATYNDVVSSWQLNT